MSDLFSKRNNLVRRIEAPITIREDAPQPFRDYLVQLCYDCGVQPSQLRRHLCQLLRVAPDSGNWSEFPNVDHEAHMLLADAPWYRVYDLIEVLSRAATAAPYSYNHAKFQEELNAYFLENGIGWELSNGEIQARGSEAFQVNVRTAERALSEAGYPTANAELKEAIQDLSRRPDPDLSGAIHHSMGALESACRKLSGDDRSTLGEIVKRFPTLFPRPLDEVVTKAWGYSSERGRHVREGGTATFEDATLVVGICATLCTYIAAKTPRS